MVKNTINERKKNDIGTGVQMSKYFSHNSPALQGNKDPFTLNNRHMGPLLLSNYIHYKVWTEITYPFPNFHGFTVEV